MIKRNLNCDPLLAKKFYEACVGLDKGKPNNPHILTMTNTYFGYISGDLSPFEKQFVTFLRHMADLLEKSIPEIDR